MDDGRPTSIPAFLFAPARNGREPFDNPMTLTVEASSFSHEVEATTLWIMTRPEIGEFEDAALRALITRD